MENYNRDYNKPKQKDIRQLTPNCLYQAKEQIFKYHKQKEYWLQRLYARLEYLEPTIKELKEKKIDLYTLSRGLYLEYQELTEIINEYEKQDLEGMIRLNKYLNSLK